MLMGPNVVRSQSVRKGGKTYRYELDPPRRYSRCYGSGRPTACAAASIPSSAPSGWRSWSGARSGACWSGRS